MIIAFTNKNTFLFVATNNGTVAVEAIINDHHSRLDDNYYININNLFSDWTNPTQNELTMFHLKYGFDFNEISSKF